MKTVSLSGTNLRTSRLGFGTSGLHQLIGSRSRQDLLSAAYDLGVRHFDTSPYYGHGIGEGELGRFTRKRRGEILIATKFGIQPNLLFARFPGLMYARLAVNAVQRKWSRRNLLTFVPNRDYGAREARFSLERSLRALGTDHVDIYFLHEPILDALCGGDELVSTLEQLRQQGKTRYIGLAGAVLDCIDIARRYPPLAQIIQIGAAPGERAAQMLAAAALPCHFSFGHFRDKNAPMNALLASAVQHFPEGVLLYSSRRKTRWAEMVAQLSEVEPR